MDDGWVTIIRKIPRTLAPIVMQAEAAAAEALRRHGRLPMNPGAAMIECVEVVYATALIHLCTEENAYGQMFDESTPRERRERLEAFDRDKWVCLICGHSGINRQPGGDLEAHHIVPRSCFDERIRPADIHSRHNLATLCREHHAMITNPQEPRWHWRSIAPALLKVIGNHELAAKVAATATDPLLDLVADTL